MTTTTALPSFVQLMASLGLDNEVQGPGVSPKRHLRTPSSTSRRSSTSSNHSKIRRMESSPSIVVTEPGVRSASAERRRRASPLGARYSPYTAPIDLRRGSMPALYSDEARHDVLGHRRSNSSSPHADARKPAPLRTSGVQRRRDRLSAADADYDLATPISSFVRRRSPQASPTSATFSARVQDSPPFPITPVSVPMLPPAVFSQMNAFSFPATDSEDSEPSNGLFAAAPQPKSRTHTGIRLSAAPGRPRVFGASDEEPPRRS